VYKVFVKSRIADLSPMAATNGFVLPWPHLIHGSLNPQESVSKRHLDRFSRFCTAHPCEQQTDRRCYVRHLQQ